MLNYDNSLRSSAQDTKRRTITCNYLYKELYEIYSHEYFDCCRLQSSQFVHTLKINAYIFIARVQRDLNGLHLHEKSREVCTNARSTALLPFKGQATKQTTVKWPLVLSKNTMQ